MSNALPALLPLETECGLIEKYYEFLKAIFITETGYLDSLRRLLDFPVPRLANGSPLGSSVEALRECLHEEIKQRYIYRAQLGESIQTLGAMSGAMREELLNINARYQSLVQTHDIQTARTKTALTYAALKTPEPHTSQSSGFLRRKGKHKGKPPQAQDEDKETLFLLADLHERRIISTLHTDRTAFEEAFPITLSSSVLQYQGVFEQLLGTLKCFANNKLDMAHVMNNHASKLQLRTNDINLAHTETLRVQQWMAELSFGLFTPELYRNICSTQPETASQPILFGAPLPAVVSAEVAASPCPPIFWFLIKEPISLPSRAPHQWPKTLVNMVNELEQASNNEGALQSESLHVKYSSEERGMLLMWYLHCLPTPLLHIGQPTVNVLIDPPAQENAKVGVLVETWKDTLGGKMVVELFARIPNVFLDNVDDGWWLWMVEVLTQRTDILEPRLFHDAIKTLTGITSMRSWVTSTSSN